MILHLTTRPFRQLCWLLLLCAVLLAPTDIAAEESVEQKGLVAHPETSTTISAARRKFDQYTLEYVRRLGTARPRAVSAVDADEVLRIDRASRGEYVADFTTSLAQDARRQYDNRLLSVVKDLVRDLNSDARKLLAKNQTEDAAFVKAQADFLEQYATGEPADRQRQARFNIDADKDWQATGVTLKAGTIVNVEAQGKWAPGAAHPRARIDMADADTFSWQMRIGTDVINGGTKAENIHVPNSGQLFARMQPLRPGMRSEARGRLNILMRYTEPTPESAVASEPLEKVLRALLCPAEVSAAREAAEKEAKNGKNGGGEAEKEGAPAVQHTLVLRASDELRETKIAVKTGDRITINAVGEWTPDPSKQPASSADIYQFVIFIDKTRLGQGGKDYAVVANRDGTLNFRPSFHNFVKQRSLTPSGSLQLSITVLPAETGGK